MSAISRREYNERKTVDASTQTERKNPIAIEDCSCSITGHRDPDFVALLCGHVFSRIGILQWFLKKRECAICREPASAFYTKSEIRDTIRKLEMAAGKLDQIHEANIIHMNQNPNERKELEVQKSRIEQKLNAAPIPEPQGFDFDRLAMAIRETNRLERSRQTMMKTAFVVCLSIALAVFLSASRMH